MTVVVGVVADALGHAAQWDTVPVKADGRNFDVRRRYWKAPAVEYRSVQQAAIRVDVDHDYGRVVGAVKYLELSKGGRLHAVCEIDGSGLGERTLVLLPRDPPRDGRDIELRALAVTRSPASAGLRQLEAFPGTLREAAREVVYQDGHTGQLLRRAEEYDRRRRGEAITVHGAATPPAARSAPPLELHARPPGRLEYRTAQHVDVFPNRTIELVAAPYSSDALVEHRGRMLRESFSNTAFAKVDEQSNRDRIRVNRDHTWDRVVGRVTHLDWANPTGLIARLKIANTELGRESLVLAEEEILGASIGFAVPAGGEQIAGGRRRVTRAWLDHVALVPQPAYEDARVIAVQLSAR